MILGSDWLDYCLLLLNVHIFYLSWTPVDWFLHDEFRSDQGEIYFSIPQEESEDFANALKEYELALEIFINILQGEKLLSGVDLGGIPLSRAPQIFRQDTRFAGTVIRPDYQLLPRFGDPILGLASLDWPVPTCLNR